MKVNKLSSVRTQLPYEYYSLPYCKPKKIIDSAENLGELLRGDRIENSLYQVRKRNLSIDAKEIWNGKGEHDDLLTECRYETGSMPVDPHASRSAVQDQLQD